MKSIKQSFVLVMVAFVTLSLFVGCSQKPSNSEIEEAVRAELQSNVPVSCDQVMASAEADGFDCGQESGEPVTQDSDCPDGCWKVALVLQPARDDEHTNDYHWYRQDDDGNWSHKPGAGEVTNLDNSGCEITHPETADRGIYTTFCGYCCVCPDQVEIASIDPREGEAFATLTLKEPAVLTSRSMNLDLPAGRLSIIYGEKKPMPTQKSKVTVYVQIYSGRKNPQLNLSHEQLEILRSKLVDLPGRETFPEVRLGYQGFLIHNPEKTRGIPLKVHVFDGAIDVWDGKSRRLYEDVHQLEQWLIMLACSAPFGRNVKFVIEGA